MTVALPIDGTSTYRRWPRFGDVIGHPEVARRYMYLGISPDITKHKVLVIAGAGEVAVGSTTVVTDTNIGGAMILLEGPEPPYARIVP